MNAWMKTMFVVFLSSAMPLGAQTTAATLADLDFLVGSWRSNTTTKGDESFSKDLAGRVLLRSSHSQVAAKNGKPAESMQSRMTIYADPQGALRAIYFDDAGHVIHYRASNLSSGHRIEFVSDSSDPGPIFRLTYEQPTRGTLRVKFEIAMRDSPAEFRTVADGSEIRTP